MSQAGEIDIIGNHPEIPTEFITDDGIAVPVLNQIEILGTSVPAGSIPVETTGSGNTVTIEVQTSQEIAASDATKIGLAAFDSGAFNVDANGFVTLMGGGGAATNIDVDAHTAPGTDPVIPNAGNIIITGAQVASGVVGANVIRTDSLAANTVTIEIQRSASSAVSDSTKNGVSHFSSAEFSVDANGFVTLAGGGLAVDSIAVQTGTSPIVPTAAGLVTINGAVVAAGTNPVRSDGTGANTLAIEIQISQAIAATNATNIGLAAFDSAAFDVDANGFVQLNGGGIAATSFDIQANTAPGTDPVVPTAAGVITVNGAAVANHSVVLETRSRAANAFNLEVQYATSAAATDATKSGVAHFNSTQFSVDANGFVALAGGGIAIDSIHPDSGTDPVVPTAAGLVNIIGSGSTTTVGSLNTLTVQLTGLTNHAILVGAGTSTITKVGPSATSGQVFQSAGAAADPLFSTATYPSTATGTGKILRADGTNWVATTATYPDTSGTSNNVLTSDGTNWVSSAPAASVFYNGYLATGLAGQNPSDSTTYYPYQSAGLLANTASTSTPNRVYVSTAFTLNKVYGAFTVAGVLGTSENVTVFVRVNDTTNTNISTTVQLTATTVAFNNTSLGVSLSPGDFFMFGFTCPAWVTNPTVVNFMLGWSS